MQHEPQKQGLYDPRFEHDACGMGFVVDVAGRRSHRIVRQALNVLVNLEHRGARGAEATTGDGAGLLLQIPHRFFARECERLGVVLPDPGAYAVGAVFLPTEAAAQRACEVLVETQARELGQDVLGWRDVPVDPGPLGASARAAMPAIRQVFLSRPDGLADDLEFERRLYLLRRRIEKAAKAEGLAGPEMFYVSSLSARTVVYKGMLTGGQLAGFYPDVNDPAVESALALVHSRFSTNTFPNWARAHPYRYVAHNGEINTLRGNLAWMRAREGQLATDLLGADVSEVLPVVDEDGSDSAMFDNVLELLALTGRSLPHAVMMMVPEPWNRHESMSAERRAFYAYHGCLLEPWDGPAAIAFTDGVQIGAVLDRNGLRPARYTVTRDGLVILASETGVLDVPVESVLKKGRLQPGRMFLVDTAAGRIVDDDELKARFAGEKPYGAWLAENQIALEDMPAAPPQEPRDRRGLTCRQQAFGYTTEDLRLLIPPMAESGNEALGSMGTDTPLAVLSERPQLLYSYFKQIFAQVTNPPVDAIREELVMGMETTIGPEGNLLDPKPESARQIRLDTPVLRNDQLARIGALDGSPAAHGFRTVTLPTLYPVKDGGAGLERALQALCARAHEAVCDGAGILILSDRGLDREQAPIPALLALSGVHHHLIREKIRSRVGLVVETGEAREVHHFALLIGYGASAVNPYLVFETLQQLAREGSLPGHISSLEKHYVKAANKGIVKVMSKMGISTVQSYHGAQVFEAIGLDPAFVERYFTGTPSRVGGVGLEMVALEAERRHARAFPVREGTRGLDPGGQYQYRRDGEHHLFNPETVHKLQRACRTSDYRVFKEYSALVNDQSTRLCTLRGLMDLVPAATPVPIEEVEPVEAIVKRFKTGAMSYGSISQEAHETLAIAMNRLGGKSNTGEGGEDPARYRPDASGDSRNSAIKQVASARFGVTSQYLVNARELQIKMAQGAKPGEGGQLPGHKVYPWIARVRHSTPGVGLISPPPHHDIYSIEDLAELIHDLKHANPAARISVKLVAEVGVGTIAAGVAKAHADVVLISGHDGGTGASPLTSIKHAGAPWELGLAETHQVLLLNGLRDRIAVETDGQLKTGRDVAVAALLGAEEFGFATAPLVALGCVMMRVCHLNTCPVGVATQDPQLRARFAGSADHVVNFMRFVAQELREIMALLGFRRLDEMVGRTDRISTKTAVDHWKARGLDFSAILYQPPVGPEVGRHQRITQNHGVERSLDAETLLPRSRPALLARVPVAESLPIRNVHRAVGTLLGSEVTKLHGAEGLPDDTIRFHFQGSAGQSFGAFIPRGVTLILEGDANDSVGKGLSGGRVVVFPPRLSLFAAEDNVIVGNAVLYGATSGEAFLRGIAGERFAVRNSGATSVVEGVGDHGCEYMTGGVVVVLGRTGRNFAAGMSGGLAYVLDEDGDFVRRCNTDMVQLTALEAAGEIEDVRKLIFRHARYTGSHRAERILLAWEVWRPRLVRVLPKDYARVLDAQERLRQEGMPKEEIEMAAFEWNVRDLAARAGGK